MFAGNKAMVAVLMSATLGACTTTNTDDYNLCALGYGVAGLGIGLASSGTGVVVAGAVGGGVLGYAICDQAPPVREEPAVVPIAVANAPEIGDSDADGVRDDRDECANTPAGVEVDYKGCAKPLVFTSKVLNFEFDSAVLPVNAPDMLSSALEVIKQYPAVRFSVSGHTDSEGSDAYNQALSERRAAAVKAFFVDRGINPERLVVQAFGESQPLSSNETEGGRARNRRVEVRLMDGED